MPKLLITLEIVLLPAPIAPNVMTVCYNVLPKSQFEKSDKKGSSYSEYSVASRPSVLCFKTKLIYVPFEGCFLL